MPIDERENRGGRYRGRRTVYNEGDPYNNYDDEEGTWGVHDTRESGDPNSLRGRREEAAPLDDYTRVSADIPIWGWLDGSTARRDAALREAEAETNRNYWENLNSYAPTVDDLSADLASEAVVEGPGSEWMIDPGSDYGESMAALDEWAAGGLTDVDEAMMDETSRRAGMDARADREAALSALEARGSGGSGASLAASLSAGEGAASRSSAANTSLLAAAQQRQYQANTDRADMDARARAGREAYNMYDTDYYRGREDRNTDRENTSRENDAEAAQQVYTNRERATAGATNQYSTDAGARERAGDDEDERNRGLLAGIGEAIGL
jgi:hypothetical protein